MAVQAVLSEPVSGYVSVLYPDKHGKTRKEHGSCSYYAAILAVWRGSCSLFIDFENTENRGVEQGTDSR